MHIEIFAKKQFNPNRLERTSKKDIADNLLQPEES